jgi:hypothetical protein
MAASPEDKGKELEPKVVVLCDRETIRDLRLSSPCLYHEARQNEVGGLSRPISREQRLGRCHHGRRRSCVTVGKLDNLSSVLRNNFAKRSANLSIGLNS